ncbi:hypothetical protein AB0I72_26675 [Nocardiopsis sp. NPDC049922]|uniref:hypothetical protein n=1 Tax=Nocardiopsis sp. NPDC049922 TaxID=3155157 RepID=UPI0033D19D79
MKVRISYTLNIPDEGVESWMTAYGKAKGEVREDIKEAVKNDLQCGYHAELTGWGVEGK